MQDEGREARSRVADRSTDPAGVVHAHSILTRRWRAFSDGAFEALVRAYQDRIYRFALRMTGSREDAEEVAQDRLVRAYRALRGTIRNACGPWRGSLALPNRPQLVRNRLRVKRVERAARGHPRTGPSSTRTLSGRDRRPPPSGGRRRGELAALLDCDAPALSRRRGAAPVEDLSYEEAAAALGQAAGTVKVERASRGPLAP